MSAPPRDEQLAELWQPVALRTSTWWSLYGVWHRHVRVYCKMLVANATPPVLEPLFYFTAVAVGLRAYMTTDRFEGLDYPTFVASGMLVASAMFTAVFETTFGTFIRLTYQKTYDAMLGTHLRVTEMLVAELLFAATKGAVYASVVVLVTMLFGVHVTWWCLLVPVVGFLTAYTFGAIGMIVTSYVKQIHNFSFFTTGVVTPLFLFSGTLFPVLGRMHWTVDVAALLVPLTHAVQLSRALFKAEFTGATVLHFALLVVSAILCHLVAIRRMRGRVVK
jgi:lipooligosaccharide transport system permease protein